MIAAILVGGSGFFIQAICEGLDQFPEVPKEIRQKIAKDFEEKGLAQLQEKVKAIEPEYFELMDNKNPHRLIRALSVYEASGQTFSSYLYQSPKQRNFIPIYIYLEMQRTHLYNRINKRVDKMMKKGLLMEAHDLHPHKDLTALKTVGYSELFDFFENKTTLSEAIELIKRNSRRYAKRQMTWFRRKEYWNRFLADDAKSVIKFVSRKLMEGL